MGMMKYEPLSKVFYKDKERYLPLYNERYQSDATYQFDFQIGKFPAFCMMTPELSDLLVSIYKQNAQMVRVAVFHYLFGYIHPFYDGTVAQRHQQKAA